MSEYLKLYMLEPGQEFHIVDLGDEITIGEGEEEPRILSSHNDRPKFETWKDGRILFRKQESGAFEKRRKDLQTDL